MGAAVTHQGEPAPALQTGSSRAAHPSMEPQGTATPAIPHCAVTLHPNTTAEARKAPFHHLRQVLLKSQKMYQDILLALSASGADL